VSQLNLSVEDFIESTAFDQIDPPQSERLEFMLANLTSILVNSFSKRKTRPSDFMVDTLLAREHEANADLDEKIMATFKGIKSGER